MPSDPTLELPDPFPSSAPRPIIPVEDEDIDDPVTSEVEAIRDTGDPREAMKMARQKLRASSQKMDRVAQKLTPNEGTKMPDPKKSD